jgi:hypothetical protein
MKFKMKFRILRPCHLIPSAALLLAAGCTKESAPPPPLAVEQAPASLEEAFKQPAATEAKQDPQVRELVNEAKGAVQSQDYTRALFALQSLSTRSDLDGTQRDFVTRAMLAVHQALEARAGAGDAKAREALEIRRATK